MYKPNPIKQLFHSGRRFLARQWLAHMPALQIGITGSQGKTSTTHVLFLLLQAFGKTVSTNINLDTVYNVPITALHVGPQTKYALFELGVDRPGEMDIHLQIVKPKIAIITGISSVHTDKDHFGSLEQLSAEKKKLIDAVPLNGYIIANGDDLQVRSMIDPQRPNVIWYGKSEKNTIRATDIAVNLNHLDCTVTDNQKKGLPVYFDARIPLFGKHHIYSILTAYAVYSVLGKTDLRRFQETLNAVTPLEGRMSVEKGPLETVLINDSLRANPSSVASGLKTVSELSHSGRKIAVLAEMGELEKPEEEHMKIGSLLTQLSLDAVILIGPLHKHTAGKITQLGVQNSSVFWTENVIEASTVLKKVLKKGDLLYLKGSLLRHVERVIMKLRGESLGCSIIVCPFYHHCPVCKYKEKGYRVL